MDALIAAAAQALAAGDLLGVLKRVGLRDDAPALALRGIAMARLGDFTRAKALLKAAQRAFPPEQAVARARCVVAEAEIALVTRDLGWPGSLLSRAQETLARHGDRLNAAHAQHLQIRHRLLLGRLEAAERALAALDPAPLPPALQAAHHLVGFGIAIRRLRIGAARTALAHAEQAARQAGVPALTAEVETAAQALTAPAARLLAHGAHRLLALADVEAALTTAALTVDACRHAVRDAASVISLARRPVLFALARSLAEAWPGDVARETLLRRAFGARQADDSHRARLRVEIGRLRAALRPLAAVTATPQGFVLAPHRSGEVIVLLPPIEEEHAAVVALLADGEAWSSSALALALDVSARTVQRSLEALLAAGQVRTYGRGPARRWLAPPLPAITTTLLLPALLPM